MKLSLATIVALLSLCGATARAQVADPGVVAETSRPGRPFRGLFGDASRASALDDLFDLHFSLSGAYDDNVLGDQGLQVPDPRLNTKGSYGLASGEATYQHSGRRISAGAAGGSSLRYYADAAQITAVESHADVNLDMQFGKTELVLRQSAQDTPFYAFRFFPGVGSDVDDVTAGTSRPVRSAHAYLFNTTATITHRLSTRSELSASYGVRRTDFTGRGGIDLTAQSVRGGYRYQFTRYAALRAGYGTEQGMYGRGSRTGQARLDTIDLGIDYRRPLSFSRRTLVDFGVGSTAASAALGGRVYRLAGDAGLTHEMGRTWNLRAAVHRGTALIEGFASPVFSDAATLSIDGFVNRRVDVHAEASYVEGEVGVTGARSPFDSLNGLGRLRVALSRKFAIFGEYSWYRYHFRTTSALPDGFPPNLRRQGIRLGLTVFVPVLD